MDDELILEKYLPYRLARLSSTVSAAVAKKYAQQFGLSIPEWRVIAIIGRHPGLSAVEVAERTFLDKVAVSRAVTKLIEAGRIDRQFADADKRRSILNLSEAGKAVHDGVANVALEFERELLKGLEAPDVERFDSLMDKLLEKANTL